MTKKLHCDELGDDLPFSRNALWTRTRTFLPIHTQHTSTYTYVMKEMINFLWKFRVRVKPFSLNDLINIPFLQIPKHFVEMFVISGCIYAIIIRPKLHYDKMNYLIFCHRIRKAEITHSNYYVIYFYIQTIVTIWHNNDE